MSVTEQMCLRYCRYIRTNKNHKAGVTHNTMAWLVACVSAVSDTHLLSPSLRVNGMMLVHDQSVDTRSLRILQHKCTTCSVGHLCFHFLLSAC
jgi:hypothetical protein